MNKQRLELMVDMLNEVAAGTWKPSTEKGQAWCGGSDVSFHLPSWASQSDCGYQACAVGHALLDKRFTDQGLTAYAVGVGLIPTAHVPGEDEPWWQWDAVEYFFDISEYAAQHLFSPERYTGIVSAAEVAARIRKFLDEYKEDE